MISRIAFCLCLLLAMPLEAGLRVVDDAGNALAFERPPQRIISLAPHLTELLFAVGAGTQLVGVDSASDYPPAARRLQRIGDFSRVNLERVLAAKPDLVVAWAGGNRAVDIHQLKRLGLPVLLTDAQRLDDVARLLRLLGQTTGHAAQGEAAADAFSSRLRSIRLGQPSRDIPLAVFYQIWDRPLMTVGGHHWISDALALCGGRNVFEDLEIASLVVSREAVLLRAPEVVVGGSDAPGALRQWQRFAALPAARNNGFVRVDADLLHRPAPRLLDGVEELCVALAPYGR
ncbi:MAG: cobalamin-binding protein [Thiobacillaceae bacterium]|nr:cobalamin-binding protein [Thiobacillaceae bacterium]